MSEEKWIESRKEIRVTYQACKQGATSEFTDKQLEFVADHLTYGGLDRLEKLAEAWKAKWPDEHLQIASAYGFAGWYE